MPDKTMTPREQIWLDWIWRIRQISERDDWIYRQVVEFGHSQQDVADQHNIKRNTVSQIVAKVRARYTPPVLPDDD